MSQLPSPVTYGTVRGRFVTAVLDTPADEDLNPDSVPIVGRISFTPSVPAVLVAGGDRPTTVLSSPIIATLDSDGSFEVKLVATDNPAAQPVGWTYTVEFLLDGATYDGFSLHLPTDATIELTLATPAPSTPGTVTIVNELTRIAAEAAATRAELAAERAEDAADRAESAPGGGTGGPVGIEDVTGLSDALNAVDARLDAVEADQATLTAGQATLTTEQGTLSTAQDALATAQGALETAQSGLEAAQAATAADVADALGSIAAVQGDVAAVQASVTTVTGDVETVQTDVAAVVADIVTVRADVETAQTSVETAQAGVAAVVADVGSLQTDVAAVVADVGTVQADVAAVVADVVTVNDALLSRIGYVKVVTGNEPRPDGAAIVIWDGDIEPVNKLPTDWRATTGPTQDTTPPTIPVLLPVSAVTDSSFVLAWEESTDDTGVDGYRVRLNGTEYGPLVTGLTVTVTGRAAGTQYDVEVSAVDTAGNESAPATVSVETVGATPTMSVFGGGAPGTTQTVHADGNGTLIVGNAFYATQPVTLAGVRVWAPADAPTGFLEADMTVFAWTGDYNGGFMPLPNFAAPARTEVHTGARAAGAWTDVLFDTPLQVAAIDPATNGADTLILGYRIGGNYYVVTDANVSTALQSVDVPYLYLAEGPFPVGMTNIDGGLTTGAPYSVDGVFLEEA